MQLIKPLLFDHIPKTGGTTVRRHLDEMYATEHHWSAVRFEREEILEFINIPEKDRNFALVHGHRSIRIKPFMPPGTVTATIFRNPIDRCLSYFRFQKSYPNQILHPLFSQKSFRECVWEIRHFHNYYSTFIDFEDFHIIATSPRAFLRFVGYRGKIGQENASPPDTFIPTKEDIELLYECNQEDLKIWNTIIHNANSDGIWDRRKTM